MKKLLTFFVIVMFLSLGSTCLYSKVKVGEEVVEQIGTPHPYPGKTTMEYVVHYPDAGYIAIHFSKFDLSKGDVLEISSPDGRFSYTYKEKGKEVRGGQAVLSEFWATHIPGDTAVVRLYSKRRSGGWGFEIDRWVRGYAKDYIEAVLDGLEEEAQLESICSNDDMEWAKCYDGTTMYDKARAVCRLLMNGSSACTGWLLGSDGHVLTNNHCIGSQSTADNTDFEFMAEGATCTTSCASWLACPGTVVATSGTLVKTDSSLDYALVLLPTNVTGTYGYLQFRNTLPTVGERIYIPQHASAWGKQLAVVSDTDGPYCKIYTTSTTPCTGGPGDIGYYADTAGGSSGSPVLAYTDHLVVSLHHCAACPNRGLPIPSIITHMGSAIPNDAIGGGVVDPPAAPSNLSANASACNQIDLSWTDNADNENGFTIERSLNGSTFYVLDNVGANVTNYSDTTVAENTTYWYRVKAYNGAGDSGYSNVASDTTPSCPVVPPAAPSNLKGKGLPGRVQLTWNDNSDNEDGFRIYRGTTSSNLVPVATVGANVTSFTDSGLARKTTYYYKVCAYNSYGEGCTGVISARTK